MVRTLDPGTPIARYRIVSPLGAGGMGEVYLARDESLDRSVALKILPPDLIKNDERVRRFVQEAKSASSLNHPHIVTIYEIGEAEDIHFIAMELVSGHTLKTLIHQEKTGLRTLVSYLAQAAEGLAKAHAAGIVHRDLKPENIMATSDGFAKVVDFGLAKLTETAESGTDLTSVPTALARGTDAGVVLGTVGYMSPEQVQGKTVDQRSDIFSLGCVLYEAATRQRPFQADSDVETLHKILKDAPAPVDELNPDVPADLRRVIRRCLAKSPDRRLQSMKDLALDLAEIDETWETLSVSTGSGTTTSAIEASRAAPRSWLVPAAAIAIGVAGLGFGLWQWLGGDRPTQSAPLANLEVTTLARITDMTGALLSADGRLMTYTLEQPSGTSLAVRQTATSQDLVIVEPQQGTIRLLALAPDTSYAYFRSRSPNDDTNWIYRVSTVGGQPRRVLENAGEIAFSADGAHIVASVVSGATRETRQGSLVIANPDGSEPRSLVSEAGGFFYAPAWSPDGQHIVASFYGPGAVYERLVAYDVTDGTARTIGTGEWETWSIAWLPDGSGFIAAASLGPDSESQLWHVAWPDGTRRRISADTNDYEEPIVMSPDGQTITTAVIRSDRSVWVAPADRPEQATRLSGESPLSLWPLRDGRVLYSTAVRGRSALWAMAADGSQRQRLTPERLNVGGVRIASVADVIVFSSQDDDFQTEALWRMDSGGGGLTELPDGREKFLDALSPDGATLYYRKTDAATLRNSSEIWRRPIDGGTEEQAGNLDVADPPEFSPDGRLYSRDLNNPPTPNAARQIEIVDATDDRVLRTLTLPADLDPDGWAWSSDALLATREIDGAANIWRYPIDGQPPVQVTSFGPGQFNGSFAYTADGEHLLYARTERAPGEVLQFRHWR